MSHIDMDDFLLAGNFEEQMLDLDDLFYRDSTAQMFNFDLPPLLTDSMDGESLEDPILSLLDPSRDSAIEHSLGQPKFKLEDVCNNPSIKLSSTLGNDSDENLLLFSPPEGRSVLRQSFNNLGSQTPDMILEPGSEQYVAGLRDDDDFWKYFVNFQDTTLPSRLSVSSLPLNGILEEIQDLEQQQQQKQQQLKQDVALVVRGAKHDHSYYTISCSENGGLITPLQSDSSDEEIIDVVNLTEEPSCHTRMQPSTARIHMGKKHFPNINNNSLLLRRSGLCQNNHSNGSYTKIGRAQSQPQPRPTAVANAPRKRGRPRREDRPNQPPQQQRPLVMSPVHSLTDEGDDHMTTDDLLNIGKRSAAVQAKKKIARSCQQLEQQPPQFCHQRPESAASTSSQSSSGSSRGPKRSAAPLHTGRQVKRFKNHDPVVSGNQNVAEAAERHRENHNAMEQKRREEVRDLFKDLERHLNTNGRKLSRKAILDEAAAFVKFLQSQEEHLERQQSSLEELLRRKTQLLLLAQKKP